MSSASQMRNYPERDAHRDQLNSLKKYGFGTMVVRKPAESA
jgi:hypothetical protein